MTGNAKTVRFYRDFKGFTGGDLKVWDYFNHVRSSRDHEPEVCFSRDSVWTSSNPWSGAQEFVVNGDRSQTADVLFLSGVDWRQLEPDQREESPVPVINLIQHVKHAWPDDPLGRYRFLSHRAIRICVSSEVSNAIALTGLVRGPLFTIPAGIDAEGLGRTWRQHRDIDLLVVATKTPRLGTSLMSRLERSGRKVHLVNTLIPRPELLDWIGRSCVTLFLPNPAEGFYLPALEGMACGSIVVCPDCVGNRSFCLPDVNCFRPMYDAEAIADATEAALSDSADLGHMVEAARRTAWRHEVRLERKAFLEILGRAEELWELDASLEVARA